MSAGPTAASGGSAAAGATATAAATSSAVSSRVDPAKPPVRMDVTLGAMYPIGHRSAEGLGWQLLRDAATGTGDSAAGGDGDVGGSNAGDSGGGCGGMGRARDWNVAWHDQSISCKFLCGLRPHQHVNHFPGIIELNRKVRMARRLGRMKARFPAAYAFAPDAWCLPMEETAVREVICAEQQRRLRPAVSPASGCGDSSDGPGATGEAESVFIIKPDKGSQAKGIFLYSTTQPLPATFAPPGEEVVMQRYINNPLLIDGYKFDLRLYVVVTSVAPLRVYLYNDGLVRMCTTLYEPAGAGNVGTTSMHLTNYTANKHQVAFQQNKEVEVDGFGFKRSIRWWRQWLAQPPRGQAVADRLWFEIGQVCARTVLVNRAHMAKEYKACLPDDQYGDRCFELLGVDVMVTDDLRPVLMEVNHSPNLATDTPLDARIKGGAVTDCLRMLGIRANEAALAKKARVAAARRRRMDQMANAAKVRSMTPEEKKAARAAERAADAAAVAARVELIAAREHENRGGFERVAPLPESGNTDETRDAGDVSAKASSSAAAEATAAAVAPAPTPEERERLRAEWVQLVEVADEVCMSTR